MKKTNGLGLFFGLLFGSAFAEGKVPPYPSLCGAIRSTDPKTPLAGANVRLLRSGWGVASDEHGRFCLIPPRHPDTLEVTYIGYRPVRLPVEPGKTSDAWTIELEPIPIPLPGVSVESFRDSRKDPMALDPTPKRMTHGELLALPVVAVPDLMRVIQAVPGVTQTSEASPQICVRGGNPDQNLILLDDVVLYYPYHFLGISSSINPDLVEAVDFSPGGFSAQYGNRLSSVLAIHTPKPSPALVQRVNVSLIGLDATFGGRIGKHIGWFVSGRTGFMDLAKKCVKKIQIPYRYDDLYTKIELSPHARHVIRIAAFENMDRFQTDPKNRERLYSSEDQGILHYAVYAQDRFGWENRFRSVAWQWLLGEESSLSVHVYRSEYENGFQKWWEPHFPETIESRFQSDYEVAREYYARLNAESGARIENRFGDRTLRVDYERRPGHGIKQKAGFQFSRYRTDYGWKGLYDLGDAVRIFFDHATDAPFRYRRTFEETSLYGEAEFALGPRWALRPGLRGTFWSLYRHPLLEPRVALRYLFSEHLTGRLAVGFFTQGISTALEEGLIQFLPLYFPVEKEQPERAIHLITTWGYRKGRFEATVSGYHKWYRGLLKSVGQEPAFIQTPGFSWGIELETKAHWRRFDLSLAYTVSRSRRIDRTLAYDTNFDQRHRLHWMGQWELGRKWSLSGLWEFHTGQPYHPGIYRALLPCSYYGTGIDWRLHETPVRRGAIRYPPYHRLDIQIQKRVERKGFAFAPYLSIRNVYNRRNVLLYKNLEVQYKEIDGKWKIVGIKRDYFSLPLIPSFGFRMSW